MRTKNQPIARTFCLDKKVFGFCALLALLPAACFDLLQVTPLFLGSKELVVPVHFYDIVPLIQATLIAGSVLAIGLKRYVWLLCLLPSVGFLMLSEGEVLSISKTSSALLFISIAVAIAVIVWESLIGFAAVIALFLVGLVLVFSQPALNIYGFGAVLFASASIWLISQIISQNRRLVAQVGVRKVVQLSLETLLFWSLLPCVAVFAAYATNSLTEFVKRETYRLVLPGQDPGGDILMDLKLKLKSDISTRQKLLENDIDSIEYTTQESAKRFPGSAMASFDRLFVPEDHIPELVPQGCGFFDVACCIRERIKATIRRVYGDERRRARARYQYRVESAAARVSADAQSVKSSTKAELAKSVEVTNASIDSSVETFGYGIELSSYLLWFTFLFASVKSFGVMLSRLMFHPARISPGASYAVSFLDADTAANDSESRVKSRAAPFKHTIDDHEELFASRSTKQFSTSGHTWEWACPRPFQALVGRLLNSFFVVNRVTASACAKLSDGDDGKPTRLPAYRGYGWKRVSSVWDTILRWLGLRSDGEIPDERWPFEVSAPPGYHIVTWELAESEDVFFRASRLVAMSSSVRISTEVSLRMSTLCLGQSIFTYAQGPGMLILIAQGKPVLPVGVVGAPIDPSRLIAWRRDCRLNIRSNLSVKSAYLDPVRIQRVESGVAVFDAMPTGRFGADGGLAGFLRSFVLPW